MTRPLEVEGETPDIHGAYPRLNDEQIGMLAQAGERLRTEDGEVLFQEGQAPYDFHVVLEGLVAIVESHGAPDERLIARHGPGRFLGELSLLTGQPAFFTALVEQPGEVVRVPVDRLREVVRDDPVLGDLILRAYVLRRSLLIDLGAGVRVIGSRYSADTRRLRDFLARNRLPHRFIDVEEDQGAETLLRMLHVRPDETPVVVWRGTEVLRNPSNQQLAQTIGLRVPPSRETECDLIVVGAGPAGLAASVYGASEGLRTVTLEAMAPGGQAGTSPRIENYLGFPAGVSGAELAERAEIQAGKFGARLNVPAETVGLHADNGHWVATIDSGAEVCGRVVVIATGAQYRRLPARRLEDFEGSSVYYAATQVEAHLCHGDPVAVVGGGNSAGQAALFLARYASELRLLVRHGDLEQDMSRYLADEVMRDPGVEVLLNTEVEELAGDRTLESLVVVDRATGTRQTVPARALFVFIGARPHTEWLDGRLSLDRDGFIVTGGPDTLALQTSGPGVFAAGDVRSGSTKRLSAAVGEGAMAVRLIHQYLAQT